MSTLENKASLAIEGHARRRLHEKWRLAATAISSICATWATCRPYEGIQHDARLYVGRVLADLNPTSLGQEIAFIHDGQSGFSIFPMLMHIAIAAFGASTAAMLITAVGLCVWVGASAYFLSRYVKGPVLWASLIALAVLPTDYGGQSIFNIAEPFATPRIFSEAAGIAALGMLVRQRVAAFFLLLAVSAALHPIMAAPVAAVGFILLIIKDRRWLGAGVLAGLAVGVGFLLKIPVLLRLTEQFDPQWMSIVIERSPHLFPRLWEQKDYSIALIQTLTLLLLCLVADRDLRRISVVAIVTAVGGIALSASVQSVLLVQLQLWRSQWLVAFLAVALLVATVQGLKARGNAGYGIIAIILVSWMYPSSYIVASAAYCAVAIILIVERFSNIPPLALRIIWILSAIAVAFFILIRAISYYELFKGIEKAYFGYLILNFKLAITVFILLTAPVLVGLHKVYSESRLMVGLALFLSVIVAGVSVVRWDSRLAFTKQLEQGQGAGQLRRITSSGSVLWLYGPEGRSWFWTRRPEWWSLIQGAGVVFDRTLAMEWKTRHDLLVHFNMIWPASMPRQERQLLPPLLLTEDKLRGFCKKPGGPTWIVAPIGLVNGGLDPSHLPDHLQVWRPPEPQEVFRRAYNDWVEVRAYGVMPCAKARR